MVNIRETVFNNLGAALAAIQFDDNYLVSIEKVTRQDLNIVDLNSKNFIYC